MVIKSEVFGLFKDSDTGLETPVLQFILATSSGIVIKILSYGATINSIKVPDRNGKIEDVVLGFDSLQECLKNDYFGKTIGRCANRIKEGKFHLNGKDYQLSRNNGYNHLHGGTRGWDKYVWKDFIQDDKLIFTHYSPDGDQGYPGDVLAQVTYCLEEDGSLNVDFQAMSSKATPINMTNHAFFNLAGNTSGQAGLFEHEFEVLADTYLPVSSNLIPTGIESVDNTPYDLRVKRPVSEYLENAPDKGFDHCFCNSKKKRDTLELAASFYHPPSGRKLEVFKTEPGLQIYTGNFLPKRGLEDNLGGKFEYKYQGGFCCEPQNYPNAVNEATFPKCILKPGEIYKHKFVYKFTSE